MPPPSSAAFAFGTSEGTPQTPFTGAGGGLGTMYPSWLMYCATPGKFGSGLLGQSGGEPCPVEQIAPPSSVAWQQIPAGTGFPTPSVARRTRGLEKKSSGMKDCWYIHQSMFPRSLTPLRSTRRSLLKVGVPAAALAARGRTFMTGYLMVSPPERSRSSYPPRRPSTRLQPWPALPFHERPGFSPGARDAARRGIKRSLPHRHSEEQALIPSRFHTG